jgi:hypothetical protein
MKKCSTSLAIKEIEIKTTLRFHLIPVRMAIFKVNNKNKYWWRHSKTETLIHCWWECKLVQPLRKAVWRFLRNTSPGHQRNVNQDTIETLVHWCSSQRYSQLPSYGNNPDALQLMNWSSNCGIYTQLHSHKE